MVPDKCHVGGRVHQHCLVQKWKRFTWPFSICDWQVLLLVKPAISETTENLRVVESTVLHNQGNHLRNHQIPKQRGDLMWHPEQTVHGDCHLKIHRMFERMLGPVLYPVELSITFVFPNSQHAWSGRSETRRSEFVRESGLPELLLVTLERLADQVRPLPR